MGAHLDIDVPVGKLKVAYQQMVAIAKALSLNSKVLILDEPTAVFTSSEIELLFRIIQRLQSQGIALLYISHHLDEIFQIGSRVTVLRDGNLIRTGWVADFDKSSLVKAMVGRDIDFSLRNGSNGKTEELLRVTGLSRAGAVEDISFVLHRGEILGVAGLVGAGRTEMARLIIGADPLDRGEIALSGQAGQDWLAAESPRAGHRHAPREPERRRPRPGADDGGEHGLLLIVKNARFGFVPWKQIQPP